MLKETEVGSSHIAIVVWTAITYSMIHVMCSFSCCELFLCNVDTVFVVYYDCVCGMLLSFTFFLLCIDVLGLFQDHGCSTSKYAGKQFAQMHYV